MIQLLFGPMAAVKASSTLPTGRLCSLGRGAFYDPVYGSRAVGTDHCATGELDEIEGQLLKRLAEVRAERDELAVAESVLERMSEQVANERVSVTPVPGEVGGRAVMLVPHRTPDMEESKLPPDYQCILSAVRQAAGPVMARQVGDAVGIDVSVRYRLASTRARAEAPAKAG
ncbi:hypothetical protein [Streptomyces werraensis]|uniref:hypothetical protein n=1 Tax=Streptomyces werraensis TaxID=68284 RepID=UPI0036B95956